MASVSLGRLATALIPTVLSGAVVSWALSGNRWSDWGVEAMEPRTPASTSFADLANITATASCLTDGSDYTVCDPYGRPYQPYVVLPARVLSALGLGSEATGPLGIALAVLLVLTVGLLGVVLARWWRGHVVPLVLAQVLLGLLAVTAPVMLAVERGQIEILTLALAVVGLLALSGAGRTGRILGAVAAVVAVVTKFFAVGLFAPFVRRGRSNLPALIGLAVSLVFLLLSWSDLQQASTASRADSPATSKSQFGAFALVATLLSDEPIGYAPSPAVADAWSSVRIAGWAMVAVAVVAASLLLRRASVESLDALPAPRALVIGAAGVLAIPFVLGASHDYRQVFLLPIVVGGLIWISHAPRAAAAWVILVGATVSMVTGAAMVPTPDGFLWPKAALVLGDLALLAVLAASAGLWVRGWIRPRG